MDFSIVTGNGFIGNAQRALHETGSFYGVYNSGFTFDNYSYNLSFKYRSNASLYLSDDGTGDLGITTVGPNKGDAKLVISAVIDGSYLYGLNLGFNCDTYTGFETTSISNITVPESHPTVVNFTIGTNLYYETGMEIFMYTLGASFIGTVISYNIGNGDMSVNSSWNAGSGSHSSWNGFYESGAWFEVSEVNLFKL